ncbi:hypothetical protein [Fimbriiglobus ruber]|uniref:hypothetical protein n=1 Tax=Fimbriiglobus ruber TaxID=1908690 RepID=UPI000B4A843D|nr:hypothetical protein [Fimbriiglobus ruber]
MPLSRNERGKQLLAARLYRDFQAMKTYGKEPESLESIISLFTEALASFPPEQIMQALTLHAQRSAEFPTPADIVGLIKRNGKPPLSQAVYIAIQKKAGEDRSPEDWQYLREYEAQQREEFEGPRDTRQAEEMRQENRRLHTELTELRKECNRLAKLLQDARVAKGIEPPVLKDGDKVRATIAAMREAGAPAEDIEQFAREHGVSVEVAA